MTTFAPDQIDVIEHFVIPMRDGRKLSARVWKPVTTKPLPVVLEYIPYRKRDIYAPRDAMNHRYFAGHGYAALRVDIRGTGDSDGHQGVFAMEPLGERVRVEVAGPPDALVDVTPAAVADLALRPGSPVWLSAKATETYAA